MKWLKQWWQENKPITYLALRQAIHPIEQATADILITMANNIETTEVSKRDIYKAAALAGLLARAGVMGGPEHNPNIIDWANSWADELIKDNP